MFSKMRGTSRSSFQSSSFGSGLHLSLWLRERGVVVQFKHDYTLSCLKAMAKNIAFTGHA